MRSTLAILAAVLASAPASADPAAELLALAPKDAAMALVVRDLQGHARRFGESPFAKWFPTTKFGQTLQKSDAWKSLETVEKLLTTQLGVTSEEVIREILGDTVVFAYRPKDDTGVVLLHAGKPETLAKVIDKLNETQKRTGEVQELREKKHGAQNYRERVRDQHSEFYWLSGATVVYSHNEAAIREAIDRATTPASAPLALVYDKLKLGTAAIGAVFQPRSLDQELTAAITETKDENHKAFLTQFQKLWTATDAVGLSLELGSTLELSLSVVLDAKAVPKELQPLFAPSMATELWSIIPADALLATGGRIDPQTLLTALRSFLADSGRAGLNSLLEDRIGPLIGKDKLPQVLGGLGPDVALWVTAPPTKDPLWAPAATLAVKLGDRDAKVVSRALGTALDGLALMIRLDYNRHHDDQIDFRAEDTPAGEIKLLVNDTLFPPGVRPAYGFRHGYLILSSSDAAVRAFAAPMAAPDSSTGLIARVSLARLRQYLTDHEANLLPTLARMTGLKTDELKTQLGNFSDVLELFDSLELRRAGRDGLLRFSLVVKPAKPLSK